MNWQEKVEAYLAAQRVSKRRLAGDAGIGYTTLQYALKTDAAWEETARNIIALAREMDTTVEYLFDPKTDWPPEPLIRPATEDERQMAIAALERLKATDALERLARGTPPKSTSSTKKKAKKPHRRSR